MAFLARLNATLSGSSTTDQQQQNNNNSSSSSSLDGPETSWSSSSAAAELDNESPGSRETDVIGNLFSNIWPDLFNGSSSSSGEVSSTETFDAASDGSFDDNSFDGILPSSPAGTGSISSTSSSVAATFTSTESSGSLNNWAANFTTTSTTSTLSNTHHNHSLLHHYFSTTTPSPPSTSPAEHLPPPTMAPTHSLSTIATNFVNSFFGSPGGGGGGGGSGSGSGHNHGHNHRPGHPHLHSSSSPRPSSHPEVFIYDGSTSSESGGNDVSSSNNLNNLSNIAANVSTSFFGVNRPTVSSSSTPAIFAEEDFMDVLNTTGPPSSSSAFCYSSPEDYELFTSMLCSSLLVLGVVYCTYGYRCFRAVAFFTGLVFGTALVYAVATAEHLVTSVPYGNLVLALAAGLLVGLLTCLVITIGLFVVGLHLGLLLGTALLTVIYLLRPYFDVLQAPLSALTLLILTVAIGLVGAFTTIYFSKGCTIIASSLYGAALTLLCADYFVENFKLAHWFLDLLSNGDDWYGLLFAIRRGQTLCLGSQVLLGLWPLLTVLGIAIQGCCTARGVHSVYGGARRDNYYGSVASTPATMVLRAGHTDITSTSPGSRNGSGGGLGGGGSVNGRSQEDLRLEQKHRKYRYLYQVRTAHGDVISQHYFQSMQNKSKLCLPDNQDSYTFNSDLSSHFLPESRTTTLSVA